MKYIKISYFKRIRGLKIETLNEFGRREPGERENIGSKETDKQAVPTYGRHQQRDHEKEAEILRKCQPSMLPGRANEQVSQLRKQGLSPVARDHSILRRLPVHRSRALLHSFTQFIQSCIHPSI